jgi:hypothetical protein
MVNSIGRLTPIERKSFWAFSAQKIEVKAGIALINMPEPVVSENNKSAFYCKKKV